jgi:hypothetical protein
MHAAMEVPGPAARCGSLPTATCWLGLLATRRPFRRIHELHTGSGIDGLWRACVPSLASRQAMVVWTVGQVVVGWIPSTPPPLLE